MTMSACWCSRARATAWSAGMDLKEYFRETEAQGPRRVRRSQREAYGWWRRLRWYQKPTIAMVNGWCFGGGYGPLFACDLAFAPMKRSSACRRSTGAFCPAAAPPRSRASCMPMRDGHVSRAHGREPSTARKAAAMGPGQ